MMRRTTDHGDSLPPGWSYLDRSESAEQRSRFADKFGELRPGMTAADWPAIAEPTPSVTFDLRTDSTSPARATARMDVVDAEAVRCFLDIVEATELVVLDWQHPGYRLDVATHAAAVDSTWRVPVYPDGDYYTFALPDFSEGTFGHPWEQTLCVFGPRLVNTLGTTLSSWLPRLRVNGEQMTSEEPTDDTQDQDPVIDGPKSLTRADFARDSGKDRYTVDGPPLKLGGPVAGGRDVTSEGPDE